MLLHAVDWRYRRPLEPLLCRFRPGGRSRPGIPTLYAQYTPVHGIVKCRKDRCLGSISGPWGPQAGFPGRLGLLDFLAAGEFQEVGIDFVGQPGVGIACLVAWMGWSGLALP